jgi:hypothetical protein
MKRIYLDTNVYSQLRGNSNYAGLRDKLINAKPNLTAFYSYAHVLDLEHDKTLEKFNDLVSLQQSPTTII